jgi:hypothetical protein
LGSAGGSKNGHLIQRHFDQTKPEPHIRHQRTSKRLPFYLNDKRRRNNRNMSVLWNFIVGGPSFSSQLSSFSITTTSSTGGAGTNKDDKYWIENAERNIHNRYVSDVVLFNYYIYYTLIIFNMIDTSFIK